MKCQCCGYEWFKTTINEIHGLCPICNKKKDCENGFHTRQGKSFEDTNEWKCDNCKTIIYKKQEVTMKNEDLSKGRAVLLALTAVGVLFMILSAIFMTSCTISFQNISTHGVASDLVDETQSNEPNLSPDISIPLTGPSLPSVPKIVLGKNK